MGCHLCEDIELIERGVHATAVAELVHGYVVLNATQYYEGASFYVARRCVPELRDLPPDERAGHLLEMAVVAAAVQRGFGARKMNYELLGNSVPHLHWWLTPRHHDDPRPEAPIWENLDYLRLHWTGQCRPDAERSLRLRRTLLDALVSEGAAMTRAFV